MTDIYLGEQIHKFVKTALIVKESQILRFFRDWDEEYLKYTLDQMIRRGKLFRHEPDYLSIAQYLRMTPSSYDSIVDAVELLCEFTSSEVLWMFRLDYPEELAIGTVSGDVYIVTSFGDNWQIKSSLIPRARKTSVPAGEEDTATYVAVVRDASLIDKLLQVVPFHNILVLNADGSRDLYDIS